MRDESVKIIIDWEMFEKRKTLKVPRAEAGFGKKIVWEWKVKGSQDLFYILFPDESPFLEMEIQGSGGKAQATVAYNPSERGAKRFKYIIAGCDGKVMHILDPEIIVPKPGRTG